MVKNCPKCGKDNKNTAFWCSKCNTKLINEKEFISSLIEEASNRHIPTKAEQKRRYMEYILKTQNYSLLEEEKYTYVKKEINIKRGFASFLFVTAVIALAFMISSHLIYEDLDIMRLNSNEDIFNMGMNGNNPLDPVNSLTITFYPDGTYEAKSTQSTQVESNPDTHITTQDMQSPQQPTAVNTLEEKTVASSPNCIEKTETAIVSVTGTWKVDDGKICVEPPDYRSPVDIPYESISESISTADIESKLVEEEKTIIVNVESSEIVSSVEVDSSSEITETVVEAETTSEDTNDIVSESSPPNEVSPEITTNEVTQVTQTESTSDVSTNVIQASP